MRDYKSIFLEYLSDTIKDYGSLNEPQNLYHPIDYILKLGGKRIRPILTLMSCDLFGGKIGDALSAASTIEMFHNFTLIHDDIMDNADLRRGSQTVHFKWNENIGILSGDALMILSYKMLETYDGEMFKKLFLVFNKTALQICEGQQYDIDFESRIDVTMEEYLRMISYKTAVLLACSLQMGAIISKTPQNNLDHIYSFGFNLGIAFQLQDDYLDTFGSENFGKKLGGDIMENKKTFLYIKTIELASSTDQAEILKLYQEKSISENKIAKVKSLFVKYGIPDLLLKEIEKFTLKAFENIQKSELLKALIEQINKDMNLAGIIQQIDSNSDPHLLWENLLKIIFNLLHNNDPILQNLLYRVDVPEKHNVGIQNYNINVRSQKLSILILQKECQKLWFKSRNLR